MLWLIGQNFHQLVKNSLISYNSIRKIAIGQEDDYTLVACWQYVIIMSGTRFRVNPHSIVAWMSRKSLLEVGAKPEI